MLSLVSLVSVLLPVYNGEKYVREAIESVISQDYPNFEFIIVDNASTDSTPEIIAEYDSDRRLRVFRNDQNVSRLENFVKAFSLASENSLWLKFIGDDDRLLPGCLKEMVKAGELKDNIGLVTSQYYDGEQLVTGVFARGEEVVSGPAFLRCLLLEPQSRSTLFSPASLLVAHKAYKKCGPFRTDLLHADHELFYRILNRYDLAYVHKPLTVSGYHSGSGQAGSTATGVTFSEAYIIRYKRLPEYDNVRLRISEVERIKFNLVTDSLGFMLAKVAAGDFMTAVNHLSKIPIKTIYHLLPATFYFLRLAARKLIKGEEIKLLKGD